MTRPAVGHGRPALVPAFAGDVSPAPIGAPVYAAARQRASAKFHRAAASRGSTRPRVNGRSGPGRKIRRRGPDAWRVQGSGFRVQPRRGTLLPTLPLTNHKSPLTFLNPEPRTLFTSSVWAADSSPRDGRCRRTVPV